MKTIIEHLTRASNEIREVIKLTESCDCDALFCQNCVLQYPTENDEVNCIGVFLETVIDEIDYCLDAYEFVTGGL